VNLELRSDQVSVALKFVPQIKNAAVQACGEPQTDPARILCLIGRNVGDAE
jgi:hypothetical protein